MKVLLLHAYSASNAGDGLLVDESLELLRAAFGSRIRVTILALHPYTFSHLDALVVDARPGKRGWSPDFREALRRINDFDLVVGVGGGYLRAGSFPEAVKTLLAHGPQLSALRRALVPVVYLPQSVGPLRFDRPGLLRRWLGRVDILYLRDDRSVDEVRLKNTKRVPDLALLSSGWSARTHAKVYERPVLSVRHVDGRLPGGVVELAQMMGKFDGYVQSTGAGNDDRAAVAESRPASILSREALLDSSTRRVVVAVRLHAALMALRAGHWVIHLAYERKGFGAFADLGLPDFVHNVNRFSSSTVRSQLNELLTSHAARVAYDERVNASIARSAGQREQIVSDLQSVLEQARAISS